MRRCLVALLVVSGVGIVRGEEAPFTSSGRYDRALEIALVADRDVPLVGVRDIGVRVTGGQVASVKIFIDGELAATDESAPYETRYDFGAAPRRHELVVVALTAAGGKGKKIFVTDDEGRLDAAAAVVSPAGSAPPALAAGSMAAPDGATAPPAPGVTSDISVVILEPWEALVVGPHDIVVDARAVPPKRVVIVEILVDGKRIARLDEAPFKATFDFGPDPRPREVKAIAYCDTGDASSAVYRSAGAPPSSVATGGAAELSVAFIAPKDGDYLAGPVDLEVELRESAAAPASRVDFFVDGSLVGTATRAPWKISWDAGKKVLAHEVKVLAYDRNGGRAEARVTTRPLDVTLTEEVREVVLTASFTDRTGKAVMDVTEDEIEVEENGKPQPVTGFHPEARPMVLALVIDASGSMTDKLPHTREAASRFVDQMAEGDRALVIAFSDTVEVIQEATSDKGRLKAAVASVNARTSTALYDALHVAVEKLVAIGGDDRKALVVLSDGADSGAGHGGSEHTVEDVEKQALVADVRCYAIDITRSLPEMKALGGDPFQRVTSPELESLAEQTGGEAFFVSALVELQSVYGQVADELRRQYWISYRPLDERHNGKWREIRVSSKKRKLYVKTRAGYYAGAR